MSVAASGEFRPHTEIDEIPRLQTALDQGVFNQVMADASEIGAWPQEDGATKSDSEIAAKTIPAPRRTNFPEAAAIASDPEQFRRLTAQELAERDAALAGAGHRAAQEVAARIAHRAITKRAGGNLVWEAALNQAYHQRKRTV